MVDLIDSAFDGAAIKNYKKKLSSENKPTNNAFLSTVFDTYSSRMHVTNKFSTSSGSMFNSVEMNDIAIRVYGRINLISTCVRIFRSKSVKNQEF